MKLLHRTAPQRTALGAAWVDGIPVQHDMKQKAHTNTLDGWKGLPSFSQLSEKHSHAGALLGTGSCFCLNFIT